jgi:hypothetical protein
MVVIITRTVSVTVPRPLIVWVPVIMVDRRVFVAGLTSLGVGVSHGRLLSISGVVLAVTQCGAFSV